VVADVIKVNSGALGRVHCLEIDLRFPQLFRVDGFCWDLNGEIPTPEPAPPAYTLHSDPSWRGYARPRFIPLDHPDSDIERGWFIIRDHRTMDYARGYLSAREDCQFDDDHLRDEFVFRLFVIGDRVFTLVPRPPIAGKPTPAFIYATEVPHPKLEWVDWYKVIVSDGRVATIDELYPLPEDMD
jgi:hypothetical protein